MRRGSDARGTVGGAPVIYAIVPLEHAVGAALAADHFGVKAADGGVPLVVASRWSPDGGLKVTPLDPAGGITIERVLAHARATFDGYEGVAALPAAAGIVPEASTPAEAMTAEEVAVEVGVEGGSGAAAAAPERSEASVGATTTDLGAWIKANKMDKYSAALLARIGEFEDLKEMTDADVAELAVEASIPKVPLRRFKAALAGLGAPVTRGD